MRKLQAKRANSLMADHVDFLIVGQGIAGTVLAWHLLSRGHSIKIIDAGDASTPSRISSGIINPYTGKRLTKVENFEGLIDMARDTYEAIGAKLHTRLLSDTGIVIFHSGEEAQKVFEKRQAADIGFLHAGDSERWQNFFNFSNDAGTIAPAYRLDVTQLLKASRAYFIEHGLFLAEDMSWSDCVITDDSVHYKGTTAAMVICCEGPRAVRNPYFSWLPFRFNKGEVLLVSIPGLPAEFLYKANYFIVPWKDDLFWVGASFQWEYPHTDPTTEFKDAAAAWLDHVLRLPYTIVDHWSALRPSTKDYSPFVGRHPKHGRIALLNGMGTKGSLMAPYLAACLTDNLVNGKPIPSVISVDRIAKYMS